MDSSAAFLLRDDVVPAAPVAFDSRVDVLGCVDVTVDALLSLEVPLPPPQSPLPSPLSSSPRPHVSTLAETTEQPQEHRQPRRKRRNSTRDRENAERAALRRQIQQLEALLLHLERGRAPSLADAVARKRLAATWERLAERQLAARRSVELVKVELVQRVQQNADWIRRLRELLAETKQANQRSSNRDRAATSWTRELSWRDVAVFGALKLELWGAYARVDQVLAASGVSGRGGVKDAVQMTSVDCKNRWSHVRSDSSGSTIVCTSVLPFDVVSVAGAAWDVIACVRRASSTAFRSVRIGLHATAPDWDAHVTEATDDSCSLKLRVRVADDSASELATYRSVAKRFDVGGDGDDAGRSCADDTSGTDSRVVLVSRTVMLAADGEDVEASDTLWIVLSRSPLGASLLSMVLESQVRRDQETFKPSASFLSETCVQGLLLRVESALLEDASGVSRPTGAGRGVVQIATV